MTRLYEGMFLLDNQLVREDWKAAKSAVSDLLGKHGAKIRTLRRWDERRLAYPIKNQKRATYFLAYFDIESGSIPALRRDLELSEKVLRHLMLACESLPEQEHELAQAELAEGFAVPPPPPDDTPEPKREEERRDDLGIEIPEFNAIDEDMGR